MPALRRYSPSVAPVAITGTTTTPGNIAFVRDSTALIRSGRRGEGVLGVAVPTKETVIFGSPITPTTRARTEAGETPGRMRQLTFAVASCGNAFGAWPPAS